MSTILEQAAALGSRAILVPMYHYVQEPRAERRGIVPLSPARFRAQLEAIAHVCDLVDPNHIDAAPRSSRPRAVITFDDGTRDQYEVAFPILRDMGIPAVFAVMSGPSVEGVAPTAHLVHGLLSALSDAELWDEVQRSGLLPPLLDVSDADRIYHYETDLARRRVKYAINFVLDAHTAHRLAVDIYTRRVGSMESFVRNWFLDAPALQEMAAAGMRIAVHAHRHLPYQGTPEDFDAREIRPVEQWIRDVTGVAPTTYIPAFGGSNTGGPSVRDVAPLLRARGYRTGFLTTPGLNVDHAAGDFFFERIDCNRLP